MAERFPNFTRHFIYSEPNFQNMNRKFFNHIIEGYVNLKLIQSLTPSSDAHFYFCGPKLFMTEIHKLLKEMNVSKNKMYFEFFGPQQSIEVS